MFKNKKLSESNINFSKDSFHKRRKVTWKKVVISIFFLFFIVILGFTIIINKYLGKINKIDINKHDLNIEENISKKESTTLQNNETAVVQNKDIKNIALFGIDETEGTMGRSDCIMILTLDNKHNKLKLCSIIRDSYVTIPTKSKKDKINHAYAFGGPQLALKTLNENFNLNINQFVTVNFSSLPKIIDSIDGITLDITTDELKYINYYINNLNILNGTSSSNITTSGTQKVDGTQALAYCRIRYTDGGDFERSQRHRTVINKLFEKCNTISVTQYPKLLNQLLPLFHTNLDTSEILSLAINLNSLKDQPIMQDRFPKDDEGNGKTINGIYYYVFDENLTTKSVNDFIFENNG